MGAIPSTDIVASDAVAVPGHCTRCNKRPLYRIDLWRLTPDGLDRAGYRVFCLCETKPVEE